MSSASNTTDRIPAGAKGIITLFVMILIFCHSAMPADLSSQESGFVVTYLLRVLPFLDPARYTDLLTFMVRKTAHAMEYTLLGFCLHWYLRDVLKQRFDMGGRQIFLTAWLCGTLYAVSDEIHQYFVPGRSCELRDVCIDAAGVLLGVWILMRIDRNRGE